MPETLPSSPASVTFNPQRAQQQTRSPFTLSSKQIIGQGAMWRASVTLPVLDADQARRWRGFFTRLDGLAGTFLLGDDVTCFPAGTARGDNHSLTGAVGATEVQANLTGTVLAGDYIACNDWLYLVKEDFAGGEGALKIWPPLRDTGGAVVVEHPKGRFRLASPDEGSYDIRPGALYTFAFEAVEAI